METLNRKNFLKLAGLSSLGFMTSGLTASNVSQFVNTESEGKGAPLRVAHLTDVHIQQGLEAEKGFASCLHAVNSLDQRPDLIINGGDAIMNSALTFSKDTINKQWALFHSMMKSDNGISVKHCIGNHDLTGWPFSKSSDEETKRHAMGEYEMSSPYYSFRQGKWKFIVLDSIRSTRSIPGYFAKLDEAQFLWLSEELKSTPQDVYVCIVSHVPILAICTLFDSIFKNKKSARHIPNNVLHEDASELTGLFYNYPNVKACLSGHIHLIDHVNYLGVDYFCNGAVSGSWWKGNYHQFPPSFSVMNFYSDGKVTRDIQYYNWKQCSALTRVN